LASLKLRNNGKYAKVPNYFISKEGKVLQLLEDEKYSNLTCNNQINKNSIFVCLENLGWLKKEPLKDGHINWIGSIYKQRALQRTWREYFLWEPYQEIQIEMVSELCNKLFELMPIEKKFVGHNTKINGVEKMGGIFNRSNIHEDYTDLSPAFDFELLNEKLKL
jgi:N-acetyl-anhydromuramyl-L-alanine amidase AmpD